MGDKALALGRKLGGVKLTGSNADDMNLQSELRFQRLKKELADNTLSLEELQGDAEVEMAAIGILVTKRNELVQEIKTIACDMGCPGLECGVTVGPIDVVNPELVIGTTTDGGGWPWWAWFLLALGICCCLGICCGAAVPFLSKKKKKPVPVAAPVATTTVPMATAAVPMMRPVATTAVPMATTAVPMATATIARPF